MRISVDLTDFGYHKDAVNCMVLVDGEPMDDVITIDVEQEYAIRYARDSEGNLVPVLVDGERVAQTERLDLTGRQISIYREHEERVI